MAQNIGYPHRLDIYIADLPQIGGSIQYGRRPVLVIQNDVGNKHSPTIIIVPLTSKHKKRMPTHVYLPSEMTGLPRWSVALCEQIQTVPRDILIRKVGELAHDSVVTELRIAISSSLGLF